MTDRNEIIDALVEEALRDMSWSDNKLIEETNRYFSLYTEGKYPDDDESPTPEYDYHNFVCYAEIGDSDEPTCDAFLLSCIYTSNTEVFPHVDQNLYFEYILSDKSPWYSIMKDLDIVPLRNKQGLITWVVVRNLNYNRYLMFAALKAFRQVYEKRAAFVPFVRSLKRGDSDEDVYKTFLGCFLFVCSDLNHQYLSATWGSDHHLLRGYPNENVRNRVIPNIETKKSQELYSDYVYYYGKDLHEYTFGTYAAGGYNRFDKSRLESRFEGKEKIVGNFLKNPRKLGNDSAIKIDQYVEQFDRVLSDLDKEYGYGPTEKKEAA